MIRVPFSGRTRRLALLLGLGSSTLAACALHGGEDVGDELLVPIPTRDAGSAGDGADASARTPEAGGATATRDAALPPPEDAATSTPQNADATPTTADATTPAAVGTSAPTTLSYDYAAALAIGEVAVFQGVKVSVWKGTTISTRNAPVVVGRPGLVRVYVTPRPGWSSRPVTAVLTLAIGAVSQTFSITKTPTTASSDGTLDSTFNFDLPGSAFAESATASVELTVAKGAGSTTAGDARVAPLALLAASSGSTLKVVIVPVRYDADGSGRLPDTSPAQLEAYRKTLMGLFPARSVTVTTRAAYPWSKAISYTGAGFSQILQALQILRQTDKAPKDTYYYGAFAPASSFAVYCSSGCVTGLSGVGTNPSDASVRASVGVGFTGISTAETAAHELGHAHGRWHAPCQTSDADPAYPYANGGLGVFGYDINAKKLMSPATYTDMMGYCDPAWISDYNYAALFDRMQSVTGGFDIVYAPGTATKYRYVEVGADGSLAWGQEIELTEPPVGELHTLRYEGTDGRALTSATGHFYRYGDLPGGYLLVPEGPSGFRALSVERLPAAQRGSLSRLAAPSQ
jgi:hypothetical protein